MGHCPNCHNCGCCSQEPDGNANTATGTPPTGSQVTSTGTVLYAITDQPSPGIEGTEGKKVLIVPILSDLVSILVGESEKAPWTPFLHLAAQAVEFELADRLMDKLDQPDVPIQ